MRSCKVKKVVRILSLLIGFFLVFMGLFGGIIASGDFITGAIVTIIGILFMHFGHKMKKPTESQSIEHINSQSLTNNKNTVTAETESQKDGMNQPVPASSHIKKEEFTSNAETEKKELTFFEKKVANTVYYETFKTVGSTFRKKSDLNNAIKYIAEDYFGEFYDGMSNKEIAEDMGRVYKYQDFYTNNVSLIPEPENEYDKNAIKVLVSDFCIGYIPKNINKQILSFVNDDTLDRDLTVEIIGGPYKELDFIEDKVTTTNDNYGFELTTRFYKNTENK
nr:MAG TPA: HRAN protein [Bacteriophage sp.]